MNATGYKWETLHDGQSMTHIMGEHYSVVYLKGQKRIVTFKDGEMVDEITELDGFDLGLYECYLLSVAAAEAKLAQLEGHA